MTLANKLGAILSIGFNHFAKMTVLSPTSSVILTIFCVVVMASKEDSTEGRVHRKRNDFVNPFAPERANNDKSFSEFGTQLLLEKENDFYWKRLLITHSSYSYAHDQCLFDIGEDIVCHIVGDQYESCVDFLNNLALESSESCQIEVDLSYTISNIGTSVESIASLSTSVNRKHPFTEIIRSIPTEERLINPNDSVTTIQRTYLDFCDQSHSADLDIQFALQCTDFDEIRRFYRSKSFEYKVPGCNCHLELFCETPTGKECLATPISSKVCTFHPHYFDIKFDGGNCASSSNDQSSGKFHCHDGGEIGSIAYLKVVASKKYGTVYFSGDVQEDEIHTIGFGHNVDSEMTALIFDHQGGTLLQKVVFHTSCSQPISINDMFGALTVVGFRDDQNDITSSEINDNNHYKFSYNILNEGPNPVALSKLTFSADENLVDDSTLFKGKIIMPYESISDSNTIDFTVNAPCFRATAELSYVSLGLWPSTCDIKVNYPAYDRISEPKSGKESKGKSRKASHEIKNCIRTQKHTRGKVGKTKNKASREKSGKKRNATKSFHARKSNKSSKNSKVDKRVTYSHGL